MLAPAAVFKSFYCFILPINKTDTSVRRATSLLKPSKDRWEVVYTVKNTSKRRGEMWVLNTTVNYNKVEAIYITKYRMVS